VEGRKIYEKMADLNLEISNNQTRFKSLENEINVKLKSLDRTNSLQIDEYNKLINQFNDLKDSYNNKIVSLNKLINRINFINSSNYIK
jgi:seryl-tRNA synthetase